MDKENKVSFSKNDSVAIKGIAICMLLCLHCFGATWRFEGYEVDFGPLGQDVFMALSGYCRICVSIFAFISGYGLYLSAKAKCEDGKSTNKWIVDRIFKTFSGYWFLYIAAVLVLLTGWSDYVVKQYFSHGIPDGVLYAFIDFMGWDKIFGTPSLNGSWWYMGAILVYILMMPLVAKWVKKFGFVSLIGLVVAVPRILTKHDFLGKGSIYSFMLIVLLGAFFAEKDLFTKFDRFQITKKKWLSQVLTFVILAACVAANVVMWVAVPMEEVWEYHLGLVPISVILFCYRYIINIPGLNKVLVFLGKHSMNIFLFHTLLRAVIMKDFIYGFKYPILIIAVLLLISLVISILLETVKKWLHYEVFVNRLKEKVIEYIA